MSLKPPKKSDLDKSWMKARQDRPKKIQPEYHLIVTEGTETEPAYFGAIRDIINSSYPDKIQLNIHGIGNNTLTLFQKASSSQTHLPMATDMSGSFMIQMIFQLNTLTKLPSFVYPNQQTRLLTMPSGLTNALNYGFFFTSVFCKLTCTEAPTGLN